MDILIQQNTEIKNQLEISQNLVNKHHISPTIINKIKIINDKLLEISETLTKLNIDIKLDQNIELTNNEKEYLQVEKQSNAFLAKVMPYLTIMAISD